MLVPPHPLAETPTHNLRKIKESLQQLSLSVIFKSSHLTTSSRSESSEFLTGSPSQGYGGCRGLCLPLCSLPAFPRGSGSGCGFVCLFVRSLFRAHGCYPMATPGGGSGVAAFGAPCVSECLNACWLAGTQRWTRPAACPREQEWLHGTSKADINGFSLTLHVSVRASLFPVALLFGCMATLLPDGKRKSPLNSQMHSHMSFLLSHI